MTGDGRYALDTSVAIPLLVASHEAHDEVSAWADGRSLCLSGHALAEAYAVLTRLPGDARLAPADAVALIDDNFPKNLALPPELARGAHAELARLGICGGATYDGLVALTARAHGVPLVTRDARARPTYEAVGGQLKVLGGPRR